MAGAFITIYRDPRRVLLILHTPGSLPQVREMLFVSETLGLVAQGGLLYIAERHRSERLLGETRFISRGGSRQGVTSAMGSLDGTDL